MPPLTRLPNRGARPWVVFVAVMGSLAALVAVGVLGRPGAPGPSAASLPPTIQPSASAPAAVVRPAIPATSAPASAGPASGSGLTVPAVVPVVAEVDDPAGDAELRGPDPGEIPPPQGLAALDIVHLATWVADGELRAEVSIAGAVPAPDPLIPRSVLLHVGYAGTVFELAVCVTTDACGSSATVPRFGATVTAHPGWPGTWVVAYSVRLDALGAWDPSRPESYAVTAVAVAADGFAGHGYWQDSAPASGDLLTVRWSPSSPTP